VPPYLTYKSFAHCPEGQHFGVRLSFEVIAHNATFLLHLSPAACRMHNGPAALQEMQKGWARMFREKASEMGRGCDLSRENGHVVSQECIGSFYSSKWELQNHVEKRRPNSY
jgi:hypothetical protein